MKAVVPNWVQTKTLSQVKQEGAHILVLHSALMLKRLIIKTPGRVTDVMVSTRQRSSHALSARSARGNRLRVLHSTNHLFIQKRYKPGQFNEITQKKRKRKNKKTHRPHPAATVVMCAPTSHKMERQLRFQAEQAPQSTALATSCFLGTSQNRCKNLSFFFF